MMYGRSKVLTPEELDKVKEARREQAIFAGYYRPKFNAAVKYKQRSKRR